MLDVKKPRSWAAWAAPALALTMAIGLAGPAEAYRRNCHFVVEVVPNDRSLEQTIYSFRVYGETSSYSDVNDLRRRIRDRITTCVQSHWANRDAAGPPEACTGLTYYEMQEYPFSNMGEQLREDLCNANPDDIRITADIELFIRGERGCLEASEERGVVDPARYVVIAPDYELTCPIRDAGGSEAYFPYGPPPDRPPLSDTRLPGNDIDLIVMDDDEGWRECWEACEASAAAGEGCAAWTYRAPGTSGAMHDGAGLCLLKGGVGNIVENAPCCDSGIR